LAKLRMLSIARPAGEAHARAMRRAHFAFAFTLAILLVLSRTGLAQYLYIDTDGDGIHTLADRIHPGTPTTLFVYLDTTHDRDGSMQSCNSHTGAPFTSPDLTIFSYDVIFVAQGGTVRWGTYADRRGWPPLSADESDATELLVERF